MATDTSPALSGPSTPLLLDGLGRLPTSDRVLLGALMGGGMGMALLLLGILRTLAVVTVGSTPVTGGFRGALGAIATIAVPYVLIFLFAGIAFGVLAKLPRTWYASVAAGFVLGGLIYGGIALADPEATGTLWSRLSRASDFALLMATIWGGFGLAWYALGRWGASRSRSA